ncbi:Vacuolar protein sorting-associated protein 51, partial [Quaeritorhiza haematococci]
MSTPAIYVAEEGGGGNNSTSAQNSIDGSASFTSLPALSSSSNTTTPTTNATSPPRTRKARNLLKAYYGVSNAPGDAAKQKRADPIDIDNHGFNAEVFLNKTLYEENLPELIRRDNELVSDIKQLDGDMKTLVYENYNKFISATDTIRKMKTNIENMEVELNRLAKNMDQIATASRTVNDSLAERRNKIHQLGGVHNLLKKLNFVFELPTRLNQCYKQQQYAQAVRYYARTSHLLAHYRHLSIFRKIEDECKVIMEQVAKRVRERMAKSTATCADVSEGIGLLLGLNFMPYPELAKLHLTLIGEKLQAVRTNALKNPPTIPQRQAGPPNTSTNPSPSRSSTTSPTSTSSTTNLPDDIPPEVAAVVLHVEQLNATFLKDLSDFVDAHGKYFLSAEVVEGNVGAGGQGGMVASPASGTSSTLESPVGAGAEKVMFTAKLTAQQRKTAQKDMNELVEGLIKDYFDILHKLLKLP